MSLTTLLIILIIIFILITLFSNRGPNYSSIKTYSWAETLWPFNTAPKDIYKHLSAENKGTFWKIVSSIIVGIFTCWLGFSLQFLILDSTKAESNKLVHCQIVDKFRPMYLEMYDSCSSKVIEELYKAFFYYYDKKDNKSTKEDYSRILNENISPDDLNIAESRMLNFLCDESNWESINYTTNKCIEISSTIAPYLNHENSQKLLSNNSLMLLNIHTLNALNDNNITDSISFTNYFRDKYIKSCVKGKVSINTNINEIVQRSYSLHRDYKELLYKSDINNGVKLLIAKQFTKCTMLPMIENISIITNEFSPKADTERKNLLDTIYILFACIFIGYMLFRIILMKLFDTKSLEPNPKMSQSDLDKINKELALYKKEHHQFEINQDYLNTQIKKLENMNTAYKKEIDLLKLQLQELKSDENIVNNSNEKDS